MSEGFLTLCPTHLQPQHPAGMGTVQAQKWPPERVTLIMLKGERELRERSGLGWETLLSALGLKSDFVPSCCVTSGTNTPSLSLGTSCEMGLTVGSPASVSLCEDEGVLCTVSAPERAFLPSAPEQGPGPHGPRFPEPLFLHL